MTSWFGASLLDESTVAEGDDAAPLFEEQIFVLRADDEESARVAAATIGNDGVLSYHNALEQRVDWRFVAVVDVKQLFADEIDTGTEVFYRFLTKLEADILLRAADSRIDDPSGERS